MKTVNAIQTMSLAGLLVAGISVYSVVPVVKADNEEKMTICHGAGQADTTHFETLTLSRNAVYQDQGEGGHFYENGTPKAGHEQDYPGTCATTSTDPSVEPSVSPSVVPSISPSVSPSIAPSISPSVAPSNPPNNSSNNNSSNSDNSSSTSSSTGEVLGAYAETGVVQDVIMNALGSLGGLMTAAGSVLYGNKKTKRNL